MLEYPQRAIRVLALLMRRYNEIDVYVEDRRYLGVYRTLVGRALGDRAKVKMIFPLGDRSAVIEECRQAKWTKNTRQLFIIDGDFDLLLGKSKPKLRGLHRLNVYCVENLLIDKHSVESVATDLSDGIRPDEISKRLDLDAWLESIATSLLPLFVTYAVSESNKTGFPTSGFKVHALCKTTAKRSELCPTKTNAHIRKMRSDLESLLGKSKVGVEMKAIEQRVGKSARGSLRYISGKTYLLPLVIERLRKVTSSVVDGATLRTLLAERVDLNAHKDFVKSITKASAGAN